MCTDTIPVLAYVKIELFFADICYYQRINPKPITDMAKKIAEQLIDTLAESGVERIYAVTGDSLNEVNEAVRKNNKIKWIHVRHEETGAYAAAAEAQLTGRPGCCAGSSGPGHVHLINGLYDAQRSGAPVIAIASTIPRPEGRAAPGNPPSIQCSAGLLFFNCNVIFFLGILAFSLNAPILYSRGSISLPGGSP